MEIKWTITLFAVIIGSVFAVLVQQKELSQKYSEIQIKVTKLIQSETADKNLISNLRETLRVNLENNAKNTKMIQVETRKIQPDSQGGGTQSTETIWRQGEQVIFREKRDHRGVTTKIEKLMDSGTGRGLLLEIVDYKKGELIYRSTLNGELDLEVSYWFPFERERADLRQLVDGDRILFRKLKKHGRLAKYSFRKKPLHTCDYKMGVKHGNETFFTIDGKKSEVIAWKNNKRDGQHLVYYVDGSLSYKETLSGQKILSGEYHAPDGKLISTIIDGSGTKTLFNPANGKVVGRTSFVNFQIEGDRATFYPDGKRKTQTTHHKGLREGWDLSWFANGGLASNIFWQKGRVAATQPPYHNK